MYFVYAKAINQNLRNCVACKNWKPQSVVICGYIYTVWQNLLYVKINCFANNFCQGSNLCGRILTTYDESSSYLSAMIINFSLIFWPFHSFNISITLFIFEKMGKEISYHPVKLSWTTIGIHGRDDKGVGVAH